MELSGLNYCCVKRKTRLRHIRYNFITYFLMKTHSSTSKYNNHTYIDIKRKCGDDSPLRSTHCVWKSSVRGYTFLLGILMSRNM